MFIRSLVTALALAFGVTGGTADRARPARTVDSGATFFVTGHGWGHGVGLSQYGAYGYALHGWGWQRIVLHYFTGTAIGQAPVSNVRVLLAPSAKTAKVSSKLPFQVTDGNGDKHKLDAGTYTVGPKLKLKVDDAKKAKALPGPLVFSPGATAVAFHGRGYRGSLQVTVQGKSLQVV